MKVFTRNNHSIRKHAQALYLHSFCCFISLKFTTYQSFYLIFMLKFHTIIRNWINYSLYIYLSFIFLFYTYILRPVCIHIGLYLWYNCQNNDQFSNHALPFASFLIRVLFVRVGFYLIEHLNTFSLKMSITKFLL